MHIATLFLFIKLILCICECIITFINLFKKKEIQDPMKKFLIVGLGNIGEKYDNTRHNIGFKIVDELLKEKKVI